MRCNNCEGEIHDCLYEMEDGERWCSGCISDLNIQRFKDGEKPMIDVFESCQVDNR